jgi:hypothetical protein
METMTPHQNWIEPTLCHVVAPETRRVNSARRFLRWLEETDHAPRHMRFAASPLKVGKVPLRARASHCAHCRGDRHGLAKQHG